MDTRQSKDRGAESSSATHQRVAEHFGKLAGVYGHGEYFTHRREAVLAQISPEVAAARRILDLGCGPGRYLAEFIRINPGARLAAIDVSPEMIVQARTRATSAMLLRAD